MNQFFTLLFLLFSFSLFAQPTDGLIAHYPFDGDALDESGNGYDGTINGTTFTVNRFGLTNSAAFFDGDNDFIQVDDTQDLRLGGSYTISLWVNVVDFDSGIVNTIFSKRIGAGNQGYLFFITGDNHPLSIDAGTCVMVVSGGNDPLTVSGGALQENNWTHVIYEYDADTNIARTYFDLDLAGEETLVLANDNISIDLKIGIDDPNQNSDFAFHGSMDDIRVYNRILAEDEKEKLLQEGTLEGSSFVSQNVSCFGESTGEIQVEVTGGIAPYNYSIDNGNTFQGTAVFSNLSAGMYSVLIEDNSGSVVTILDLEVIQPMELEVVTFVNGNTITVNAEGGTPDYVYSLDGVNFQESNVFADLPAAEYSITVQDASECQVISSENIIISSTSDNFIPFSIFPNPTKGEFIINAGTSSKVKEVLVVNAQAIQVITYAFTTNLKIDLGSVAPGIYYVILKGDNGEILGVEKMIKISTNRA